MTAAQRRLKAWAKMTSKQKLADMEKEDRRRKKMLRAGLDTSSCDLPDPCGDRSVDTPNQRKSFGVVPSARAGLTFFPSVSFHAAAAQLLYHKKP